MTDARTREQTRLAESLERIDANLREIGGRVAQYQTDIQAAHDHMWEARRDMDHIDKIAMRQSIDQMMRSSDVRRAQARKLGKLRNSPWFGRFDFRCGDTNEAVAYYVGIHDFRDEETQKPWVYDWRAPISSLFYDHETGPAPDLTVVKTQKDAVARIAAAVAEFRASDHTSLAVLADGARPQAALVGLSPLRTDATISVFGQCWRDHDSNLFRSTEPPLFVAGASPLQRWRHDPRLRSNCKDGSPVAERPRLDW